MSVLSVYQEYFRYYLQMSKRGKYGRWSQADLEQALNAYRNNGVGLNECQRRYNIPKATLKRHLENRNKIANELTKVLGRPADFDKKMESVLTEHILKFEERMFGLTITDIRRIAYDLAEKNHITNRFNSEKRMAGKKWFYGFMRRHPQLSVRQPESTSIARAKGFNRERVQHFFNILEQLVDKYRITANTIFNVDESGYSTVQKRMPKVVSLKGKRQVGGITSGERGVNTTAVCCLNAAGLYIPPMLIFKRKRYAPELAVGAPLGGLVEISDTGYMNSELFLKWLKHFNGVVQPGPDKEVLLLLDGHSTHSKNLEALIYAREHNIHLLQLPGHTTHRLQPLDVAFFKPLQSYYVQAQEKWLRSNIGKTISQYNVASLISEAYGRAATVEIAASAFRGSGIWPVDRNHFKEHDFAPSEALRPNDEQLQEDNELEIVDDTKIKDNSILQSKTQSGHEYNIKEVQFPEIEQTTSTTDGTSSTSLINVSTTPNSTSIAESSIAKSSIAKSSIAKSNIAESNIAKSSIATPSCSKTMSAFEMSLNKVSPLPEAHLVKMVKRKTRATQIAVELTSSPYKTELEEKRKAAEEKPRKRKLPAAKSSIPPKKTVKTQEKKGVRNLFMPKNTTRVTEDIESESSAAEDENDTECLYCGGTYLCSKKGEGWARCYRCHRWAHEECAGIGDEDDFICDLCLPN